MEESPAGRFVLSGGGLGGVGYASASRHVILVLGLSEGGGEGPPSAMLVLMLRWYTVSSGLARASCFGVASSCALTSCVLCVLMISTERSEFEVVT